MNNLHEIIKTNDLRSLREKEIKIYNYIDLSFHITYLWRNKYNVKIYHLFWDIKFEKNDCINKIWIIEFIKKIDK
jgi:ABC-type thiamin/hydroxymethylpyrimidine transport system permease subunit